LVPGSIVVEIDPDAPERVAPALAALPKVGFVTGPPLLMQSSFFWLGGMPQSHATSLATHPHAVHTSRVV
jgi:hypothetical protein